MNIIVCIKQVLDTEAEIRLNETKTAIIEDEKSEYVMNPLDEVAIEAALQTREKFGGDVTLISLGPERVKNVLVSGLAMGADKAVYLKTSGAESYDSLETAFILSDIIRGLQYDIIFCGVRSVDVNNEAIGVQLAELLSLSHISSIIKLDIEGGGKKVVVHRSIEGGEEVLECGLPVVLTCQKGLAEPRYPTLPNIMKAKKKPCETKEVMVNGGIKIEIVNLELPPKRGGARIILKGEPLQQVQEALKILAEKGILGDAL